MTATSAELTFTPRDCIGHDGDDECTGTVELRPAMSASGICYPRCEAAYQERSDLHERLRDEYPDSPSAPSWFDPSYAGECWDDE